MEDESSKSQGGFDGTRTAGETAWRVVEHSWAETSIMEGANQVCLLSIEDEATEETQDALERRTAGRAHLIAAAPAMLEALRWFINDIDGTHTVMRDFDAAVAKARSAISQATQAPEAKT